MGANFSDSRICGGFLEASSPPKANSELANTTHTNDKQNTTNTNNEINNNNNNNQSNSKNDNKANNIIVKSRSSNSDQDKEGVKSKKTKKSDKRMSLPINNNQQPKLQRTGTSTDQLKLDVSNYAQVGTDSIVSDFKHNAHATLDADGTLSELPIEMVKQIRNQYGIKLSKVITIPTKGYPGQIPIILICLRNHLKQIKNWNDSITPISGLRVEGLFLNKPSKEEVEETIKQMNDAQFQINQNHNAFLIAFLIKKWYADLPEKLLSCTTARFILGSREDEERIGTLITTFTEPNRSTLLWLLDLIIELSYESKNNKLSPRTLTVLFCPNLYDDPDAKELAALLPNTKEPLMLAYGTAVSRWLLKAVYWRQKNRSSDLFDTMDLNSVLSISQSNQSIASQSSSKSKRSSTSKNSTMSKSKSSR